MEGDVPSSSRHPAWLYCEAGVAPEMVGCSAVKRYSAVAGLQILGDRSIQGNIKDVSSLIEPLQVAMGKGERRALIPIANKRNFLEVSGDIMERVDPIFYADPMTAAIKALGLRLRGARACRFQTRARHWRI